MFQRIFQPLLALTFISAATLSALAQADVSSATEKMDLPKILARLTGRHLRVGLTTTRKLRCRCYGVVWRNKRRWRAMGLVRAAIHCSSSRVELAGRDHTSCIARLWLD